MASLISLLGRRASKLSPFCRDPLPSSLNSSPSTPNPLLFSRCLHWSFGSTWSLSSRHFLLIRSHLLSSYPIYLKLSFSSIMNSINTILKATKKTAVIAPRLLATQAGDTQTTVPKPSGDPTKTFYSKDLKVIRATGKELHTKPKKDDVLKFGHNYSDHMAFSDWTEEAGWTVPQITPLRNLSMHPGAKVLHYAAELFEGMKAYRGVDNKIRLFRPEMNMARMRKTARRAALPDFDGEELIKVISEMVTIDQEWVPYSSTSSLYIRPTLIGTDPTLGVAHAREAKLFVLTGPVGQYYATGFQPITLLADPRFVRASPGGVGAFKMGCNYAPTINVGKEAAAKNCQQVLWLYGEDQQLTEVGTMNIFVLWKNEQGDLELATPPLNSGLILPGVTRDSLIAMGKEWNEFKVVERKITMNEIKQAMKEKRLLEIFGAGTAAVVSPVDKILFINNGKEEMLEIPTMEHKPNVMQRFYEAINDIQYGRVEHPTWVREVPI